MGTETGFLTATVLISHMLRVIHGVAIDNGVVGEPTITCGTEKISFWVKTQNAFVGKVYVKGEYGNSECTLTFTSSTTEGVIESTPLTTQRPSVCPPCPPCPDNQLYPRRRKRQATHAESFLDEIPQMAHLTVFMNTCGMKRERSLNPPGVTVTFTTVVSFHDYFLTKVDKAYQIRCFYMEADKTVVSEIDVSMPQTTELVAQAEMPTCHYTIRRDTSEGSEVRFARVGDKVFHRWECISENLPKTFGMLVHSCYVSDGQDQNVQIIDEKGCSNDLFAIGDLTYTSNLLANVEAHVFKFADRAVLDFECAITICVASDGGCDGLTPPDCGRARLKRNILVGTVNKTLPEFGSATDDQPNQWNLHAQRLTVVDLDDNIQSDELVMLEKKFSEQDSLSRGDDSARKQSAPTSGRKGYYQRILNEFAPRVCLTVVGFGVLVALCTFIFTVAAIILGTLFILKKRDKY